MFDLEQAIAEWRRQMLAEGIQSPVPMEELECHLREDIEWQLKSGLSERSAFEASIQRIGRPEMLGIEFKKSERPLIKIIGILAAIVGAVIISRILTEHPNAEHLRRKEQTAWLITGSVIVFFGLAAALFVKVGDRGVVRTWKLIGAGYSIFASAFSIFLTALCIAEPTISSAFTITDWILVFAANMVSIFSIAGWQRGYGLLPVIRNSRLRTAVGMVCSLLAVLWMLTYIVFVIPQQLQTWITDFLVMFLWALSVMSLLGGAGFGLEKAAHESTAT